MRKFYSRLSGCPDVPTIKVYRLYNDENYRISFCKSSIPDETFREMFFRATMEDLTNEEKMNMIYEIYKYVTRNLNIDPNDYCIEIMSRNNPFNNVHN